MRKVLGIDKIKQYDKQACGPTSLAMVINFLKQTKLTGHEIDQDIRREPWFGAGALDMVNYARKMGLQAKHYNHGTKEDIKKFIIDLGIPMIALIDPYPNNRWRPQWHWVVIVGIEEINNNVKIIINNPSQEVTEERQEWPWDKFSNGSVSRRFSEEWAYPKALGIEFGYNNYFIGIEKEKDILPPERTKELFAGSNAEKGMIDILNGWAHIRKGKCDGLCQLLPGVVRLFVCGISLILNNIYWLSKRLFVKRK